MAVCEIWDVRGRLDHPIDYAENPEKTVNPKYTDADLQVMVDVMEYATNKDKTEQRFFVTGVNCDPTTARDEMMIAKVQWNDTSEIVCYHGFQSFKHGEVTPEQAHEVGVKLAERMWGDRFQVIVATHLNTDCLHNHFVVNSVSFADGMHYHDNKANLRLLRQRSDELCREYALSVIEHPSGKKKPYALYQAEKQGRPTRDNVARQAVDEAISKSFTLARCLERWRITSPRAFMRNTRIFSLIPSQSRQSMKSSPYLRLWRTALRASDTTTLLMRRMRKILIPMSGSARSLLCMIQV